MLPRGWFNNQRIEQLKKDSSVIEIAVSAVPLLAFSILIFMQGGYFQSTVGFIALGMVVFLFLLTGITYFLCRSEARSVLFNSIVKPNFLVIALSAICLLMLVSGITNGLSLTMLEKTGFWCSATLVICGTLACSPLAKSYLSQAFLWVCIALSTIAVILFSSGIANTMTFSAGRLIFPFEYSNAAGVLYGIAALLCISSPKAAIRATSWMPILALLLTESVGSIGLFAAGFIALMLYEWKRSNDQSSDSSTFETEKFSHKNQELKATATLSKSIKTMAASQLLLAILCFGFISFLPNPSGLIVPIVAFAVEAATFHYGKRDDIFTSRFSVFAYVACIIFCVAAVFFMSDRLHEASYTFIERLIQIADGLSLFAKSPIFGIGPETWRDVYLNIQTTQYSASSIHSSYMQVALDGGIFALLLLWGCLFILLKRLFKNKAIPAFICVLISALHAFIDFDFQFAILLILPFIIASYFGDPVNEAEKTQMSSYKDNDEKPISRIPYICILLLLCIGIAAGLWAQIILDKFYELGEEGNGPAATKLLESTPFSHEDKQAMTDVLKAWYLSDQWDHIDEYVKMNEDLDSNQALVVAASYYDRQNSQKAEEILLSVLERQPYNYEMFEIVGTIFEEREADIDAINKYNELAKLIESIHL